MGDTRAWRVALKTLWWFFLLSMTSTLPYFKAILFIKKLMTISSLISAPGEMSKPLYLPHKSVQHSRLKRRSVRILQERSANITSHGGRPLFQFRNRVGTVVRIWQRCRRGSSSSPGMLFNADFLLFNMDWRGKVGVSEGRPQPPKEPSSELHRD